MGRSNHANLSQISKQMNLQHITPPFLTRVAQHMHQQWDVDFRKVAIVFNNKRPVEQLKKELAQQIQKPFWSPTFYTIQDFIRKGHSLEEASGMEQFFLLNRLHTQLQRSQDPSYEESLDHFFPLAEIILNDFAQLDYDLVAPEKVFTTLEDIAEIQQHFDYLSDEQKGFLKQFWNSFSDRKPSEMQKRFLQLWKILPVLYTQLKKELAKEGKSTMASLYKDLAEQNQNTQDPTLAYDTVLFVGFNALNNSEITLFKRWHASGKAHFYFDADTYFLDDTLQEAGHFLRKNLHQFGLPNALGQATNRFTSERSPIEIFAAPGMLAQANVVRELLQKETSEQTTAIILADEGLLIPVLQQIPPSLYEQLNMTMGIPSEHAQSLEWVKHYLEFQLQSFTQNPLWIDKSIAIRVITHPFSGLTEALKEQTLTTLNEQLGTHVSHQLIPKALLTYPAFFDRTQDVTSLMRHLRALLEALLAYQPDQSQQLALEYEFLRKALQEVVVLEKGFAPHPHLTLPLAIKLIRRSIHSLRAVVIGDPMAPIQVMGLLETRNLHYDRIILVGANEGVLPATHPSPSLIPDNLRRAFDLPIIYNQQALSAYLFYRLVGSAQTTQIIYNRLQDAMGIGEPSRFIRQLAYESPLKIIQKDVRIAPVSPIEQVASMPLTRIAKKGEVWNKLKDFFSVDGQKPKRTLSASAFTLYLQSPLEFFYKYVAGIPEPPEIKGELEANTLGSMLHKVMEWCYLDEKEKEITLDKSSVLSKIEHLNTFSIQALQEQWPEYRKNNPKLTGSEQILVRMTEKHASLLLQHDAHYVAPFKVYELENERDYHMPIPLEIDGQKETIWLKGIIDRIDKTKDGYRIVDYKTGGDDLTVVQKAKGDPSSLCFFEQNWQKSNKAFVQTLFYALIYEYCTGIKEVVPNVYSTRLLNNSIETHFYEKISNAKSPAEPIIGSKLANYKVAFIQFLTEKLTELFNPEVPFSHDLNESIYPSSPYWYLVMQQTAQDEANDKDSAN
jgi:ATP-dependent helicase/nuclease subunit B